MRDGHFRRSRIWCTLRVEWSVLQQLREDQHQVGRGGRAHHDLGQYQPAIILFEKALAFRKEQGQPVETRIAKWAVARCRRSLGQLDVALQMQRDLEKEFEGLEKQSGFVFEELGECLLTMGREEEAKGYFAKAYQELCQDPWIAADQPARLARLKHLGGV